MIIAVSSQGDNLESRVDPRFGRTRYFVLYDTSDESFKILDNTQNVAAAQGAGVQASQSVVRNKAEVVVSGRIGPKAYQTLTAAGIKVISWDDGSVSQAVEMVKNNHLKPADGETCRGIGSDDCPRVVRSVVMSGGKKERRSSRGALSGNGGKAIGIKSITAPLIGFVVRDIRRPDSLISRAIGSISTKLMAKKQSSRELIDITDKVEVTEDKSYED